MARIMNTYIYSFSITNIYILPDFPRYASTTNAHTVIGDIFMLTVESFL